MNFDRLRAFCLSMPDATEDVQWESLLFRIRRKIFATYMLDPPHGFTLKATPERGGELLELDGVERAQYVGRYGWITIYNPRLLPDSELKRLVQASYEMAAAKAPKDHAHPRRRVTSAVQRRGRRPTR